MSNPNPSPTPSPAPTPTPTPAPPPAPSAEQTAQQYVHERLEQARRSLRRTRVVSIVVVLAVLVYMGFVTATIRERLAPESAAELAVGVINDQVQEKGALIADRIRAEAPRFIRQLPDYALQQLPVFRAELELQFEQDLLGFAKKTSHALEVHLDVFLGTHEKEIRDFIKNTQDEKSTQALGAALQKELVAYLNDKSDGESIQDKIDAALELLNKTASHLDRLAKAPDLTDDEKRARRAIAVALKKVDWDLAHKHRENVEKLDKKSQTPAKTDPTVPVKTIPAAPPKADPAPPKKD